METSDRKKVLVLGSAAPSASGQGIEFDYCSVHSVWAFKRMGFETIIINNNPETVSTDFDVADKLYFEPLTAEDVQNIVEQEKPWGAVVQFGGQTAIKLAKALTEMGVPDPGHLRRRRGRRRRPGALLTRSWRSAAFPGPRAAPSSPLRRPCRRPTSWATPVLVRPSYVLGGQGMEIAYNDRNIEDFMKIINMTVQEHPILIDKYLMGRELEVDGVFDGEDILIPGIMEHVERAGVHSGDSIAVYPPINLEDKHRELILKHTKNMAKHLNVIGPHQRPVYPLQRRHLRHRGQPPLLPHHSLYLQGDRRAHHRPGHQGHAGAEAEGPGLRHRHLQGGRLLRRQGPCVLLREAHRRGHRPWPGDEVHRRGAGPGPRPIPRPF